MAIGRFSGARCIVGPGRAYGLENASPRQPRCSQRYYRSSLLRLQSALSLSLSLFPPPSPSSHATPQEQGPSRAARHPRNHLITMVTSSGRAQLADRSGVCYTGGNCGRRAFYHSAPGLTHANSRRLFGLIIPPSSASKACALGFVVRGREEGGGARLRLLLRLLRRRQRWLRTSRERERGRERKP